MYNELNCRPIELNKVEPNVKTELQLLSKRY